MTLAKSPGGNECAQFSRQRKPLYRVLPHALPTGERFPILINSHTGVPPTFALRYALTRRSRGGSSRLHALLRGLADLYEWCEEIAKIDLDGLLLSGHTIGEDLLAHALNDVDRANDSHIAGVIQPAGLGGIRVAVRNVRAHNRRVRAWRDFLIWALEPKNWRSGSHPEEDPARRSARRDTRFDLELFFDEARQHEGTVGRRAGLTAKELEAIELAIGPNEQGEFPHARFAHSLRLRSWAMFGAARWGGLRRGEILKLQVGDIPLRVVNRNAGQMALLRRRHLEVMPTLSGEEFFLHVPRVKKPGAVVAAEDCARWAINGRLGRLLLELQPECPSALDRPLLPFLTERNPYSQLRQKLFKWADDVDLVTTRLTLDQQGWRDTRFTWNQAPTIARLPLTAYRFRRTIATNLAEQGATIDEIAAFLDDQTTAMAAVNVENTSVITDVLAETLDRHPDWIKVITLFRGGVAEKNAVSLPEILGGAPHLADYEEFSAIGTIGYCASENGCRWEPPLSCYLCPFFRAISDSRPHERQLAQIQREIDQNVGRESDRMAAIFRRHAGAMVQLLARIARSKGAMANVLDRIKATRTRPAHPSPSSQPETKETLA